MSRAPCLLLSHLFVLVAAVLLAFDFAAPPAAAAQEASRTKCLTVDEINCLLSNNCTDADAAHQNILLLGRVRLPKTASTLESTLIRRYEDGFDEDGRTPLDNHVGRFLGIADKAGCSSTTKGSATDRVCFTLAAESSEGNGDSGNNDDHNADEDVISLAFRPMQRSKKVMGHVSYDAVASGMEKEILEAGGETKAEGILLTGLRDPASYAAGWYGTRRTSDMFVDLASLTFAEWIERVPWRMNVLTRVLGSTPDRKTMPESLLYVGPRAHEHLGNTDKDEFMKDAYMLQQNELGPEKSSVYQLAVQRLRNDFVHFTILHRLPDSWRLMAHRFCWDMDEQEFKTEKANRGVDALMSNRFLKGMKRAEAEEIWDRLQQRNRLDLALMEEADRIMDERLAQMEAEKADGVLCNFLGRVKVTCEEDASSYEL